MPIKGGGGVQGRCSVKGGSERLGEKLKEEREREREREL